MKTTVTVITQFPDRADVRNVEDLAKLGYIELVVHGISYGPAAISRMNGEYKCLFEVETEPDTAPALGLSVVDDVQAQTRLG